MEMECGGALTAFTSTTLDDLFTQNTEVDVGMEWLSIFVEDCLSGQGSCLPPPSPTTTAARQTSDTSKPSDMKKTHDGSSPQLQSFAVAGKARSKRKRIAAANSKTPLASPWSQSLTPETQALGHFQSSDTLLLNQTYWLADSELIAPKKPAVEAEEEVNELPRRKAKPVSAPAMTPEFQETDEEDEEGLKGGMGMAQARRCSHCLSQRTPQWRAGPLGPKTLCNACGVRYKSGRLLPEYRPAKSPTFVSYLHSNSHKKVMEMRNGIGMPTGMGMRTDG